MVGLHHVALFVCFFVCLFVSVAVKFLPLPQEMGSLSRKSLLTVNVFLDPKSAPCRIAIMLYQCATGGRRRGRNVFAVNCGSCEADSLSLLIMAAGQHRRQNSFSTLTMCASSWRALLSTCDLKSQSSWSSCAAERRL